MLFLAYILIISTRIFKILITFYQVIILLIQNQIETILGNIDSINEKLFVDELSVDNVYQLQFLDTPVSL